MKKNKGIVLIILILVIVIILVICVGAFRIIINNKHTKDYESQADENEGETINKIVNETDVINSKENEIALENALNNNIESEMKNNILIFQELKKYEGESKSYEETYNLLTKYYQNCTGLVAEMMNGNIKLDLDIALDMSKAGSKLINAEQSLKQYANEYLDESRTYNISMSLKNNNIVDIIIKSEK